MSRGLARASASALAALLLVSGTVMAGPTRAQRATAAAGYVEANQKDSGAIAAFSVVGSTADAVVSLVAAGGASAVIERALDLLKRKVRNDKADTVGEKSKVAMAVVAADKDPRSFAGHDLIDEIIDSEQSDGRYGSATPVFEHALALLALDAVGEQGQDALGWLRSAQCPDGGWQFDEPYMPESDDEHCFNDSPEDFFTSDTNTTSLAVQAIGNTDIVSDRPPYDYVRFFDSARDPAQNGWIYSPAFVCDEGETANVDCFVTDANSTALVIQAYVAGPHPLALPDGAMRALKRLQYPLCGRRSGAFAFSWQDDDGDGAFKRSGPNLGASIGAILGLLRRPLPVLPEHAAEPAPIACP